MLEATRGGNGQYLPPVKVQNFVLCFGCDPSFTVKADTTMIADVKNAILKNFDPNTLVLKLQETLDNLQGKDASFEFVTPSAC